MTIVRLSEGVTIRGIRPEILFAIERTREAFAAIELPKVTITSCTDGKHSSGSLHYVGQAFDFRTHDMSVEMTNQVVGYLIGLLGADYDVIRESDHVHVEFQPKISSR